MIERETLTLSIPIRVERRDGERGFASGCSEECPYRMPLMRGFENVAWCSLFKEDIPDSGKARTADCMAAGATCSDDPHTIRERT